MRRCARASQRRPVVWPTRWTTRLCGTYQHSKPARLARRQKSTSSKYRKNRSSSSPIRSKTSRRTSIAAPTTQSVTCVSERGGGATTRAASSRDSGPKRSASSNSEAIPWKRRAECCGRPSGSSSRLPAIAAPGWCSMKSSSARTAPGRRQVSSLSKSTKRGGSGSERTQAQRGVGADAEARRCARARAARPTRPSRASRSAPAVAPPNRRPSRCRPRSLDPGRGRSPLAATRDSLRPYRCAGR